MHVERKAFRIMATVAFAAAILSEVTHTVIQQVPWEGYTLVANNISLFLVTVWSFAIASLWSVRNVYKPGLVVGILLLGAHALVLSVGGNRSHVAFYSCMFAVAALGALYTSRIPAFNRTVKVENNKRTRGGYGI